MRYRGHGRKVIEITNGKEKKLVISGQWVGHKYYGHEDGTEIQRKNVLKNYAGFWIDKIYPKIFWGQKAKELLLHSDINGIEVGQEVCPEKFKKYIKKDMENEKNK